MPGEAWNPVGPARRRLTGWPLLGLFLLFFAGVVSVHGTLLHLPYFWDEGGYYVPAALDFYHRWTLIPTFTNAHPPLPNVVLGLLWHLFGVSILATRLTACVFAACGLLAVYELGSRLLDRAAGLVLAVLTAVYPIWFAQSSLAHADIFAAAFTLAALSVYLPHLEERRSGTAAASPLAWTVILFSLSVLSKETAIIQPVTLAALELVAARRTATAGRGDHLRWACGLLAPVLVLSLWFGFHRWQTGFTFGNPEFLRYNATANFTLPHIAISFWYRGLHLFWQRNIWLAVLLALACLWLPRRVPGDRILPRPVLHTIAALILANWSTFSILGGALLTRYLLPVYPLILLLCVAVWRAYTQHWLALAALTAAAFISALWLNPPTYFAPEDNLTYRNMIVVHQEAIAYLQQHLPDATVLTAWPASAELQRPELGYTQHRFRVFSLEDFTAPEIAKAAQQPGRYDAALVFSTHYIAPTLRTYLLRHPDSRRGRRYAAERDLSPNEIAALLGGQILWQDDRDGEWAAVLRFPRSYEAHAAPLLATSGASLLASIGPCSALPYTKASRPLP